MKNTKLMCVALLVALGMQNAVAGPVEFSSKPVTRKGVTYFEQTPEEFARHGKAIKEAGADMIGGCCGTDADFIKALVEIL